MSSSIRLINLVNKKNADSLEDAEIVFPIIESAIKQQQKIDLSFEGMDICSTIFLNNFLGKLYLTFGTKVDEFVTFTGFDEENDVIPNKIDRLKKRALNPEAFKTIFNNATGKA